MVIGRRLTLPKRCSTAASIKSRASAPLTPLAVARKLMASRSQQSDKRECIGFIYAALLLVAGFPRARCSRIPMKRCSEWRAQSCWRASPISSPAPLRPKGARTASPTRPFGGISAPVSASAAAGRAHAAPGVAHLLVVHHGIVDLDFEPEDLRRKRAGRCQHRIGGHHAIALGGD